MTHTDRRLVVIHYPQARDLGGIEALQTLANVTVVRARAPQAVQGARWLLLPDSHALTQDLAWLRAQGLDTTIAHHAQAGGAVLGLCAGLQMLGEALIDTERWEGNCPGLGLLPLVSSIQQGAASPDLQEQVFGVLPGAWQVWSGQRFWSQVAPAAQTVQHPAMAAKGDVAQPVLPGVGWRNVQGNVLGLYLRGVLQDEGLRQALCTG